MEYVGFKYGFPLQIRIGLILVGNGFTNLDHGLRTLLLYPKVTVSFSVISKPKLKVGNKPVSLISVKSCIVSWFIFLSVFSTLSPNKKENLSLDLNPYWV